MKYPLGKVKPDDTNTYKAADGLYYDPERLDSYFIPSFNDGSYILGAQAAINDGFIRLSNEISKAIFNNE